MKKKVITISAAVLVIMLALFAFTACNNSSTAVGEELVQNGDFSSFNATTKQFDNWSTSTTATSSSFTFGQDWPSTSNEGEEEVRLYLNNDSKAYSNIQQRIHVDNNRIYKVSVDIAVVGSSNLTGAGAYVAFLENTDYQFVTVKTAFTDVRFTTCTFYVRPKNTDYLTLALCVGSEEDGSTGHVLFDNVSVQRVEKGDVPAEFDIINFRKARTLAKSSTVGGILFVTLLTVFTVCLLVAAYILICRLFAQDFPFVDFDKTPRLGAKKGDKPSKAAAFCKNGIFIAVVLALGAFLIRLAMLLTTSGMGQAMTSLISSARELGAREGVFNYMTNHAGNTMSPGSMYILAVIGAMGVKLSNTSVSILIRFVNVLADMAVVLMIYFYGKKRVGNKLSTIYAAMYAVLPFVFVMSGFVGTFECVLVALMLATVILMVNKQYLATYLMATLSAVFDVRALAIAPIIVAYFVYMYIKDGDIKKFTSNRAQIVFGLVATIPLAYLLTLPVGINQIAAGDAFFNFKVIVGEVTNNTTFADNAFNLYSMVAMNGKTLTRGVSILNFIFILVLEAYAISLYFKNRNRKELILLASFVLAVIAVFTVKVSYTYLFLSIAFALVYTMVSGDKRMYIITGGYATLGFLDVAQLLNQSGFIAGSSTAAITGYETTSPFLIVFSVLAVLLTGYYVYVVYSITNNTKIVDIKPMPDTFAKTFKNYVNYLKQRFARKED